MISSLRAELRKILSVRSTYVIIALCLLITFLVNFYVLGYRLGAVAGSPNILSGSIANTLQLISFLIALIGVLAMTHEYRYNTIMYTLASAGSRLQVLLAKFLVVSGIAIVLAVIFALLAPLLAYLGFQAGGHELAPQAISWGDVLWRGVFVSWGYAMLALLIATLIRNQVGTIIFLLIGPGTIEMLLGLLLKENAKYLPFNTLFSVLDKTAMSPGNAALLFLGYLAVGWAIAALLFVRRDAN